MIKNFYSFLSSKAFLKHLSIYLGILMVSIWIMLSWIDSITKHGEYIKVPNFIDLPIKELKPFAEKNNVTYRIVDSIFDTELPGGIVINQEPEFNAEVKEGREVFIYITASQPPDVEMPKLIDRSLRQAISMIHSYGLKLGRIDFKRDDCVNCVLEQSVKGKRIKPGTKLSKGTVIDLIAGKGTRDITVRIPCLYGLTASEAISKLAESSLSVGKTLYDEMRKSPNAKVYKQMPPCDDKEAESLEMGASIDIFLTTKENKIPNLPVDSVKRN